MSQIPDGQSRRRAEEIGKESKRLLKELRQAAESFRRPEPRRIVVNKRTHRVRFEGETEDEVTVVIERRR